MPKMYDLIIIGGGPAGITAGIYAVRHKLEALMITKGFGGQMARKAVAIENYPGFENISGADLVEKFVGQLKKHDIEIIKDSVKRVKKKGEQFEVETSQEGKYQSKTVLVATGADPRPLEVPGEKEFIGKGVSYCTTCDAPLFAQKTVVVVGGGNAGFEAAIAIQKHAKKVYILEFASQIKADESNQKKAKETGKIEVITSAALKKIEGDNFVQSITYQDRKSNGEKKLSVEGVFVEIGNVPATGFVKELVEFNQKDEIKIDPKNNQTKTPGLYAAGDVTEVEHKQIVIACGEATKAVLSIYDHLEKGK